MAYFRYQVIIDVNDPRCNRRLSIPIAREEHYNHLNRMFHRFLDRMPYVISWGVMTFTLTGKSRAHAHGRPRADS